VEFRSETVSFSAYTIIEEDRLLFAYPNLENMRRLVDFTAAWRR